MRANDWLAAGSCNYTHALVGRGARAVTTESVYRAAEKRDGML